MTLCVTLRVTLCVAVRVCVGVLAGPLSHAYHRTLTLTLTLVPCGCPAAPHQLWGCYCLWLPCCVCVGRVDCLPCCPAVVACRVRCCRPAVPPHPPTSARALPPAERESSLQRAHIGLLTELNLYAAKVDQIERCGQAVR